MTESFAKNSATRRTDEHVTHWQYAIDFWIEVYQFFTTLISQFTANVKRSPWWKHDFQLTEFGCRIYIDRRNERRFCVKHGVFVRYLCHEYPLFILWHKSP